jgi:hypothetical protein
LADQKFLSVVLNLVPLPTEVLDMCPSLRNDKPLILYVLTILIFFDLLVVLLDKSENNQNYEEKKVSTVTYMTTAIHSI